MCIIIRNVCAILLLVPFGYCNQSTNNSYSESKLDTILMRREIPRYSDGKERWGYLFKNRVLKQINGDFLENGFDSIQIRIWSVLENIDSVKLLVLKNIDHEWSADLYSAYYSCDKDSIILKQVKSDSKTPKSGWNAFIKELFMLKITSISDYSKVKGYGGVTKGDTFFVEIASKSEYKFSEHPAPFLLKDSIMEADRMCNILNLLQSELGY